MSNRGIAQYVAVQRGERTNVRMFFAHRENIWSKKISPLATHARASDRVDAVEKNDDKDDKAEDDAAFSPISEALGPAHGWLARCFPVT